MKSQWIVVQVDPTAKNGFSGWSNVNSASDAEDAIKQYLDISFHPVQIGSKVAAFPVGGVAATTRIVDAPEIPKYTLRAV